MYEINIKFDDTMEFPLYTNIVDDSTYVVGGKTFQAGDVIELTPEEQTELAKLRKMEMDLRDIRQWIVNEILKTDRTFLVHVQPKVHSLNVISSGVRHGMSNMLLGLSRRLGGIIPVIIDKDLTTFTVRERKPTDTLNYTRDTVFENLGLGDLVEARELAAVLDPNRANTCIDLTVTREFEFQPVMIKNYAVDPETFKRVAEFLKMFPRPTGLLVLSQENIDKKTTWITPIQSARPSPNRWEGVTKFAHDKSVNFAGVLAPVQAQRGREDLKTVTVNFSCMAKPQGKAIPPATYTYVYEVTADGAKMADEATKTFEWKPDEIIKKLFQ